MSDPEGLVIARRLIAEEAEKKTGFLDLGRLGLSELPTELLELEHLRSLNLGSVWRERGIEHESRHQLGMNRIEGSSGPIQRLSALEALWLYACNVSDLAPFASLVTLTTLDCSYTRVDDLTPVASLANLRSLRVAKTQVSDLTPLASLHSLQELDFSSTRVSDLLPLASLAKLTDLLCFSTQVRDLAPLASLANLQTIFCGATPVIDLLPLASLLNLRTLYCSSMNVSDFAPLRHLIDLAHLYCASTQITDLAAIASFASLRTLKFSDTQVSDLDPLAALQHLEYIDCSTTQVSDLTPLASLQQLRFLDCSDNQVSNLAPLAALQHLEHLNCFRTLVSDITPLASLRSLQSLDCGDTQVSDLTPLAGLQHLEMLDCSDTRVVDLAPLASCQSLMELRVCETQVNDLAPVGALQHLEEVDCSYTRVNDLAALLPLVGLRILRCQSVELATFPQAFLDTPVKLFLFESTIPGVPSEALSQHDEDDCFQALQSHYIDLQSGGEIITNVKVVLLGNGRIGKTQICRRLCGDPYDDSVPSTHGISVRQTHLLMNEGEPEAILNLWDFGGQDLYHGTHALFLKARALFLLIWTPQSESGQDQYRPGMIFRHQPLSYWVDYVRAEAGSGATAILVQSCCDEARDEASLPPMDGDETKRLGYVQDVRYSAKTNRRRPSLDDALREGVRHLRGREGIATIGKGRAAVKRELHRLIDEDSRREPELRQNRTMTHQTFRDLCERAGNVSSPESLLEYLHNAGIVFHRPGLFDDAIVLDQSWALNAIYAVFDRESSYPLLKQLGGRFRRSTLAALVWQEHSSGEQELFLSMMESCGICFRHRAGDERRGVEIEYVAPDLLPTHDEAMSQLSDRWDAGARTLERTWTFRFLPHGLVRNIISRIGREAGERAVYWKYGVRFYEETTRANAIIEQTSSDSRQGTISLKTQGDRGELLVRISEWIDVCRSQAGNHECEIFGDSQKITPLRQPSPHGRTMPLTEEIVEEREVEAPLRFEFPPRPEATPQVCVSYAWSEEQSAAPDRAKKVEEFCERLKGRGHDVIRDTEDLRMGDRLSAFMQQGIAASDRIYIFLSEGYLRSVNCMNELTQIWENSGRNPERFLPRVRAFVMPGTKIYEIEDRMDWAAHWRTRYERIHERIRRDARDINKEDFAKWERMQYFAPHISAILHHVADVLHARDFDTLIHVAREDFGDDAI